jgi:Protein of unknown function (DUF1524)
MWSNSIPRRFGERLIRRSREPNTIVRGALEDVFAAGGSTAIPLILYCYRRYQNGADAAAFKDALASIESFLVRRMIAGEGTNNLNSMFGLMCSRVNTDPRFAPGGSLADDIRRVLASRPADWPTDEEVERGVKEVDFYKAQSAMQRIHVLRRIDQRVGSSGVALQYEVSDKSIEHIAPQGVDAPDWKSAHSATEWDAICARVHTLPNLTLLTPAENSSVGWKGWVVKRSAFEACDYPMTNQIARAYASAEQWGQQELDRRALELATLVNGIWPRCAVSPHAEADTGEVMPESDESDDDESELQSLLESEIEARESGPS